MAKRTLLLVVVLAGAFSFASSPARAFVENTSADLQADEMDCPRLLTDSFEGTFELLCFTTEPWTFDEFHERFLWAADTSTGMRPHGQWIVQDTPSGEILYLVTASTTDAALVMYWNSTSRYAGVMMAVLGDLELLEDGPLGMMAPANAVSPLGLLGLFNADDSTFGFEIRNDTYVETGRPCDPSSAACGLQLLGLDATDAMEEMSLDSLGWRVSTFRGQRVHTTITGTVGVAISESNRGVGIAVFRYPASVSVGPVVRAP